MRGLDHLITVGFWFSVFFGVTVGLSVGYGLRDYLDGYIDVGASSGFFTALSFWAWSFLVWRTFRKKNSKPTGGSLTWSFWIGTPVFLTLFLLGLLLLDVREDRKMTVGVSEEISLFRLLEQEKWAMGTVSAGESLSVLRIRNFKMGRFIKVEKSDGSVGWIQYGPSVDLR